MKSSVAQRAWFSVVLLFSCCVFAWTIAAQAWPPAASTAWTNQFPNLARAVYGNGTFLVAGEVTEVSTNGRDWRQTGSLPFHPQGVVFGNGRFLVQSGESVFLSTNGLTWTNAPGVEGEICSVSNEFVYASYGFQHRSQDGINWTFKHLPNAPFKFFTFSEGRFLARTDLPGGALGLAESFDSETWRLISTNVPSKRKVYLAGGFYFTPGADETLIFSRDASDWLPLSLPNTRKIIFADGAFHAVADGAVARSIDLTHWDITNLPFGYGYDLIHTEKGFLVLGYRGHRFFSEDGVHWIDTDPREHFEETKTEITFGAGKFAAAAGAKIFTSINGVNWTSHPAPDPDVPLYGIAFGAGKFVAGGARGCLYLSDDATNWVRTASLSTNRFTHVRHIDGRFYALGSPGLVAISNDGLEWRKLFDGELIAWNEMAYGDGTFVLAGEYLGTTAQAREADRLNGDGNGRLYPTASGDNQRAGSNLLTSNDGVHFSPVPGAAGVQQVVFWEGAFLGQDALGYRSYRSQDGQSWQEIGLGDFGGGLDANSKLQVLDGILYRFTRGVISENRGDGLWRTTPVDFYSNIRQVAVGNGVRIGISGANVFTARRVVRMELSIQLERGNVAVRAHPFGPVHLKLERSSDAVEWKTITEAVRLTDPGTVWNGPALGRATFYRAELLE